MSRSSLLLTIWNQNRPALIILCCLLAASGALFLLQTQLLEPKINRLSSQQSELQQQVRQRQLQVTTTGLPLSTAERIDEDLQKFRELIPEKLLFSEFIGELFSWAEQADLEIDQINYRPEPLPESGLLSYGLNFSVQGSYEQIKHFIHQLENSARILIIDKISLAGANDPQQDQQGVALQIELTTYFREVTP